MVFCTVFNICQNVSNNAKGPLKRKNCLGYKTTERLTKVLQSRWIVICKGN